MGNPGGEPPETQPFANPSMRAPVSRCHGAVLCGFQCARGATHPVCGCVTQVRSSAWAATPRGIAKGGCKGAFPRVAAKGHCRGHFEITRHVAVICPRSTSRRAVAKARRALSMTPIPRCSLCGSDSPSRVCFWHWPVVFHGHEQHAWPGQICMP